MFLSAKILHQTHATSCTEDRNISCWIFSLGHFFLLSLAAVHIIELLKLAVNARELNLFKYLEMNDFSGTNLNAYKPIASYFHYWFYGKNINFQTIWTKSAKLAQCALHLMTITLQNWSGRRQFWVSWKTVIGKVC